MRTHHLHKDLCQNFSMDPEGTCGCCWVEVTSAAQPQMVSQAANAPVACRKHRCMCHEPFNINTQPLFCLIFTIWPQPNREEVQQSPLHSHLPQSDTTARSTHKQSEKYSKHCLSLSLIIYMWLQQRSDQRCSTNQFSLQSTAAVPVQLFSSEAAKLSQSINAIDQTANTLTDPICCKWEEEMWTGVSQPALKSYKR